MISTENKPVLFWFRRDLRLEDNAGLYHALKSEKPVQCLFIFDSVILDALEDRDDARLTFIYDQIQNLDELLDKIGSSLWVFHGNPVKIWKKLLTEQSFSAVFCNHDYEPYALKRDDEVKELLSKKGIPFNTFKDQCILEKNEVLKDDGKPYTVFTPYKRRWLEIASEFFLKSYPSGKLLNNLQSTGLGEIQSTDIREINFYPLPNLGSFGFRRNSMQFPSVSHYNSIIAKYAENRDFPGLDATSRISIHLRFGTVSIRELASQAKEQSAVWLNELIWRDFYFSILWHFPHVVGHAFKPEYDRIKWRNNEAEFKAWQEGRTGFPLVDAGMRELSETGFMHNRVRMVTASFLTKDLLIDWRWGEAWFARKLLDFELSSNNGGWQWTAGTGCDAAPYFRIFNPSEQLKKFDSKLEYVRRWIPEFDQLTYPQEIVDHKAARERCLKVYQNALTQPNKSIFIENYIK